MKPSLIKNCVCSSGEKNSRRTMAVPGTQVPVFQIHHE